MCAHKCAQNPDVFNEIVIASRNRAKCDAVARAIGKDNITTDQVDADDVDQLVALFERHRPDMVINLALPYQDLTIMEACLRCGVHYLDTANYEPKDEAHFEYSWQWAFRERFEQAGLTAILGCGFDPGVSGVYTAYAAKHHFGEMQTLDIVDCNAGSHQLQPRNQHPRDYPEGSLLGEWQVGRDRCAGNPQAPHLPHDWPA